MAGFRLIHLAMQLMNVKQMHLVYAYNVFTK